MKLAPVLVPLVLLAGCSSAPVVAVRSAPVVTVTASPTVDVLEVAYLARVRPDVQGSSDAALVQLGRGACVVLDAGSMHDSIQSLEDQGFGLDAAIAVSFAAVRAYCPQHAGKISE